MDTTDRLLNDFTSWYWWLSVVVVGLAINLASAYLKSPLDRWLSRTSSERRVKREHEADLYEKQVAEIAGNETLLLLEGQRAASAEVKTYVLSTLIGVNLILLFLVTSLPEPRSFMSKVLVITLSSAIPILMLNWLSAFKNEQRVTGRFAAAQARFRQGGRVAE